MLTQTSESAIRALIFIALSERQQPVTPREIADELGESPTYMAKITRQLVRANILRSLRGAAGGVILGRPPEAITLLAIVEACQGMIVANYCEEMRDHPEPVCNFHTAMKEIFLETRRVLSKWTLKDLADRPGPAEEADAVRCRMAFVEQCGQFVNCRSRLWKKDGARPAAAAPVAGAARLAAASAPVAPAPGRAVASSPASRPARRNEKG